MNTSGSKVNSNTNKSKTIKKEKPIATTLIKPNKVKKELLAKIKDFQVKAEENGIEKKEVKTSEEEFDEVFNDEFNKSLNFLQELSKQKSEKHQQKKNHRNTLKKGRIENEIHMQIATELPADLMDIKVPSLVPTVQQQRIVPTVQQQPQVRPPLVPTVQQQHIVPTVQQQHSNQIKRNAQTPPYGILKQGSKPTFREWHIAQQSERSKILQTIKNEYKLANENKRILQESALEQEQSVEQESVKQPVIEPQQSTVQQAVQQPTEQSSVQPTMPMQQVKITETKPKKPTRYKKRITKTLKYKLGKQGSKVSILIKNNQTRKRVQHEIGLLKQKSIMDIKNYLREKNLLKVGSYAPNDVLRQMYEQSILAGDIENKGKDTFIHNYFNDKPN